MKPYSLFTFFSQGGWWKFHDEFETLQDAMKYVANFNEEQRYEYQSGYIVFDAKVIFEYEFPYSLEDPNPRWNESEDNED